MLHHNNIHNNNNNHHNNIQPLLLIIIIIIVIITDETNIEKGKIKQIQAIRQIDYENIYLKIKYRLYNVNLAL